METSIEQAERKDASVFTLKSEPKSVLAVFVGPGFVGPSGYELAGATITILNVVDEYSEVWAICQR